MLVTEFNSRFPSLGIPRLELENPCWNTYVGHWNSNVGIPMSNVGIPRWVFQVQPRNSEAREPTTVLTDSFIKWFRDFAACLGYSYENKILITSVGQVSSSSCVIIQFW